jgi:competence protein ComEA
MTRFFQKLSEKLGLTQTELKVNAFLIIILFLGGAVKFFNWEYEEPANNFDYSATDSIFYAAKIPEPNLLGNNAVDYNQESLDFNKRNFVANIKKTELAEKSVNLNTAGLEQLMTLPGIGVKTAQNIIAFRKANGGFSKLEDLLEIKGIASSKFNKIKKYIFIQ